MPVGFHHHPWWPRRRTYAELKEFTRPFGGAFTKQIDDEERRQLRSLAEDAEVRYGVDPDSEADVVMRAMRSAFDSAPEWVLSAEIDSLVARGDLSALCHRLEALNHARFRLAAAWLGALVGECP